MLDRELVIFVDVDTFNPMLTVLFVSNFGPQIFRSLQRPTIFVLAMSSSISTFTDRRSS
jgi:hypothetical protein